MTFWQNKRVIVTGGGGFLGRRAVERLRAQGAADVIAPRSAECDLRQIDAVRPLLGETSQA